MIFISALLDCAEYHRASEEKKKEIQKKRLSKLVQYARMHSPAVGELYKNIGAEFEFSDLPVTSKQMIMQDYDRWVTDSDVKLSELKKFVADTKNVGKRFLGKYNVVTTSGSTGYPLIYLMNPRNIDILSVESIFSSEVANRPMATMYPHNRFLIPVSTLKENLRRFPFIKWAGFNMIDTSKSIQSICDELERIKPKSIIVTPSTFMLIAEEFEKRGASWDVEEIICGSEKLTDKCAEYMERVFKGAKAKNTYGCTEGGNMAFECEHGHLHLHNSWDIIEPVDADNNPVPFGQKSEKYLLTNLSSYTLPIIRYEVNDRITLHDETCSCGDKNPWMEIEGRSENDLLVFRDGDKETKLPAVVIYFLIETQNDLRRFQLVLRSGDTFECRLECMPGADKKAVFEKIKVIVGEYLAENGVTNVKFCLSDIGPQIDKKTFKLKNIYQD